MHYLFKLIGQNNKKTVLTSKNVDFGYSFSRKFFTLLNISETYFEIFFVSISLYSFKQNRLETLVFIRKWTFP